MNNLATQISPIKMPEVSAEIEQLSINLDYAENLLGQLETRLSGILAIRAEIGDTGASSPEPVRVPVADVLHSINLRLGAGQRQIQSLLDRIEL